MKPVTAPKDSKPNDIAFAVAHDLRAPLINVRGFAEELERSVFKMTQLTDEFADSMPDAFKAEMKALARDDVAPCVKFLIGAVEKLEGQVDHIARYFALDEKQAKSKSHRPIDGKRRT